MKQEFAININEFYPCDQHGNPVSSPQASDSQPNSASDVVLMRRKNNQKLYYVKKDRAAHRPADARICTPRPDFEGVIPLIEVFTAKLYRLFYGPNENGPGNAMPVYSQPDVILVYGIVEGRVIYYAASEAVQGYVSITKSPVYSQYFFSYDEEKDKELSMDEYCARKQAEQCFPRRKDKLISSRHYEEPSAQALLEWREGYDQGTKRWSEMPDNIGSLNSVSSYRAGEDATIIRRDFETKKKRLEVLELQFASRCQFVTELQKEIKILELNFGGAGRQSRVISQLAPEVTNDIVSKKALLNNMTEQVAETKHKIGALKIDIARLKADLENLNKTQEFDTFEKERMYLIAPFIKRAMACLFSDNYDLHGDNAGVDSRGNPVIIDLDRAFFSMQLELGLACEFNKGYGYVVCYCPGASGSCCGWKSEKRPGMDAPGEGVSEMSRFQCQIQNTFKRSEGDNSTFFGNKLFVYHKINEQPLILIEKFKAIYQIVNTPFAVYNNIIDRVIGVHDHKVGGQDLGVIFKNKIEQRLQWLKATLSQLVSYQEYFSHVPGALKPYAYFPKPSIRETVESDLKKKVYSFSKDFREKHPVSQDRYLDSIYREETEFVYPSEIPKEFYNLVQALKVLHENHSDATDAKKHQKYAVMNLLSYVLRHPLLPITLPYPMRFRDLYSCWLLFNVGHFDYSEKKFKAIKIQVDPKNDARIPLLNKTVLEVTSSLPLQTVMHQLKEAFISRQSMHPKELGYQSEINISDTYKALNRLVEQYGDVLLVRSDIEQNEKTKAQLLNRSWYDWVQLRTMGLIRVLQAKSQMILDTVNAAIVVNTTIDDTADAESVAQARAEFILMFQTDFTVQKARAKFTSMFQTDFTSQNDIFDLEVFASSCSLERNKAYVIQGLIQYLLRHPRAVFPRHFDALRSQNFKSVYNSWLNWPSHYLFRGAMVTLSENNGCHITKPDIFKYGDERSTFERLTKVSQYYANIPLSAIGEQVRQVLLDSESIDEKPQTDFIVLLRELSDFVKDLLSEKEHKGRALKGLLQGLLGFYDDHSCNIAQQETFSSFYKRWLKRDASYYTLDYVDVSTNKEVLKLMFVKSEKKGKTKNKKNSELFNFNSSAYSTNRQRLKDLVKKHELVMPVAVPDILLSEVMEKCRLEVSLSDVMPKSNQGRFELLLAKLVSLIDDINQTQFSAREYICQALTGFVQSMLYSYPAFSSNHGDNMAIGENIGDFYRKKWLPRNASYVISRQVCKVKMNDELVTNQQLFNKLPKKFGDEFEDMVEKFSTVVFVSIPFQNSNIMLKRIETAIRSSSSSSKPSKLSRLVGSPKK